MSHQTGAGLSAFPCQTIELIKKLRQAKAVQIMYKHVPAFQACRCHGNGTRTKIKPKNAKIGYRGYVGSMVDRDREA